MLHPDITNSNTMIVIRDETNMVTPGTAYVPSAKINVRMHALVFRCATAKVWTTLAHDWHSRAGRSRSR